MESCTYASVIWENVRVRYLVMSTWLLQSYLFLSVKIEIYLSLYQVQYYSKIFDFHSLKYISSPGQSVCGAEEKGGVLVSQVITDQPAACPDWPSYKYLP